MRIKMYTFIISLAWIAVSVSPAFTKIKDKHINDAMANFNVLITMPAEDPGRSEGEISGSIFCNNEYNCVDLEFLEGFKISSRGAQFTITPADPIDDEDGHRVEHDAFFPEGTSNFGLTAKGKMMDVIFKTDPETQKTTTLTILRNHQFSSLSVPDGTFIVFNEGSQASEQWECEKCKIEKQHMFNSPRILGSITVYDIGRSQHAFTIENKNKSGVNLHIANKPLESERLVPDSTSLVYAPTEHYPDGMFIVGYGRPLYSITNEGPTRIRVYSYEPGGKHCQFIMPTPDIVEEANSKYIINTFFGTNQFKCTHELDRINFNDCFCKCIINSSCPRDRPPGGSQCRNSCARCLDGGSDSGIGCY
ncbi:hypothetical protein ACFL6Y_05325 [Elusimicrobiota bacterium]